MSICRKCLASGLEFINVLPDFPIRNVIYHAAVASSLGTSFLTERHLDIDLLHSISGDPATRRHNQLLQEHFEIMLPFADGVPVAQLLKLRRREEEAFFRFQAAMHRMVTEIRSQGAEMTVHDARSLYGDVIRPRLAELDQRVNEAKRDLVRHPAASPRGNRGSTWLGFLFRGTCCGNSSRSRGIGSLQVSAGHDGDNDRTFRCEEVDTSRQHVLPMAGEKLVPEEKLRLEPPGETKIAHGAHNPLGPGAPPFASGRNAALIRAGG